MMAVSKPVTTVQQISSHVLDNILEYNAWCQLQGRGQIMYWYAVSGLMYVTLTNHLTCSCIPSSKAACQNPAI